jgi:hypothetical protein
MNIAVLKLFNKSMFIDKTILADSDFVNTFGPFNIKYINEQKTIRKISSYDIIFLSYDEPNAEENWKLLLTRFPEAKRVHKIKGILNAHKMASSISDTKNFYVIDADATLLPEFNFDSNLNSYDVEHYVHIWKSKNLVNGLEYGYGGVKLFNKNMFKNINVDIVDMSTILGDGVKLIDKVACITHFDSSPFHAFRSAFRETCKLSSQIIKNQNNDESLERLNIWCTIFNGAFKSDVQIGALLGKEYGIKYSNDLKKLQEINNFEWLYQTYRKLQVEEKQRNLLSKFDKLNIQTIINLTNLLYNPDVKLTLEEIRDCLSSGQLLSKFWLIDELNNLQLNKKLTLLILGGWIGSLSNLLFQHYYNTELLEKIISVDLDSKCEQIADLFNIEHVINDWRFKAVTQDMLDINYEETQFKINSDNKEIYLKVDWDIIINTSCEHLVSTQEWFEKIPDGKMVIVQSNNFANCDQHINCVKSLDELEKQCHFNNILYKGTLPLSTYDRYMIIGIK